MPVYRQSKLVHIHIPKTGGTAIEKFFHSIDDMVWGEESWVGQRFLNHRWYEFQHLSLPELHSFTEEFRNFHSFAVIRNPYSRLVSEFQWRDALHKHQNSSMLSFDSFEEFIEGLPDEINDQWPNILQDTSQQRTNFLIHVRPQYQYVCISSGKQVVNELLKFEQLKDDFGRLLSRCGLQTDMIRTPGKKKIDEYFDRKMLDRVNTIYARDFSLGGYEML